MLTFDIQAHDDTHLSDSDLSTSDADPTSVTVEVVARKEIYAGKEMPVNDDQRATSGDGALTPSDATLDAWISAATDRKLQVFVNLEGGKKGDALFLEDGHDIASTASITSSWSWNYSTNIGVLVSAERRHSHAGRFSGALERPCVSGPCVLPSQAFGRYRFAPTWPQKFHKRTTTRGMY